MRLLVLLMSACLLTGMHALPSEDRGVALPPVSPAGAAATAAPNEPTPASVVTIRTAPTVQPWVAVPPVMTARPAIVPVMAAVAHPAPTPYVCPPTWFCYPKLGIAGPVVPYSDCTATVDIGDAIRQYTCAPGSYLMGHAYTDFGFIRAYQIGDSVIYAGTTFVITSASEVMACGPMAPERSPLSLQTSLTFTRCGKTLVLHAIPILH